ncbi:S-adenosyl-L-methionine-dependent methyltransferase [Baffinella frigidus]|nr:S-adenosyl-L-methionine-dependent methyltransferase [Cryptophyta sp. CCMP2293]
MRVTLLLLAAGAAAAFAPLNPICTGKQISRALSISSPVPVARVCDFRSRLVQLRCTLASPDDTAEVAEAVGEVAAVPSPDVTAQASDKVGGEVAEAGGEEAPANRKERRRMNKKTRNRERNRIVDPETQASIQRKDALSQNFLSDPGIIERFAEAAFTGRANEAGTADASDPDGERLVELGPGLGAVTRSLQREGANLKMTVVELDGQSCAHLREEFPGMDVREESLLDFDFATHAQERGGRLTVVSNAPFGISSATLYHLLDNSEHISRAVLLLQEEVVHRVLADSSKRKYSSLSVEHALRAEHLDELFVVPSIAFTPAPRRTKTSVLAIDFAAESPLSQTEAPILRATLQASFKEKGSDLRDSLWRSAKLRALVPGLRQFCDASDANWLAKRPADIAVGKWLHIARSLGSFAAMEDSEESTDEAADEAEDATEAVAER